MAHITKTIFYFCILSEIWSKSGITFEQTLTAKDRNKVYGGLYSLLCNLYEKLSIPKKHQIWESKTMPFFYISLKKDFGWEQEIKTLFNLLIQ